MDGFIETIKKEVDSVVHRKGHGKKHVVTGSLPRGSPWFYPDDPLLSDIPDIEVHYLTPVFVCIWEFLDKFLTAPPCPFCNSAEHVSPSVA